MTRKRKKRTPLGPAWLADMTIAFKGWQVALPLAVLSWMWRHWRGVGSVLLAALLFVWTGEPVLAGMSLFVVYGLAKWRPATRKARWWDEETLKGALVSAGILTIDREGRVPSLYSKGKMLSRRGQPIHNEHGTTVVVNLPRGKIIGDMLSRKDRLASGLGVPENRLTISKEPDDNANVARIHVAASKRKGPTAPPVATAERTDWSRPIRIGVDDRGREVTFATTETHTIMAGATGSGKSVLGHLVVAHAALDPRVKLYGIDGKGDAGAKGWQPLEPICEAFVRGMGADSPARIEALLSEVYALSEQRGADGHEAPEIVLILEEWAAARTVMKRLDSAAADRCDALVTVLLATARSRGVHILVIAQRGTATSFPVDQRANCGQRLVGKFGDRAEAGYVLESLPSRLPERAGEFAVSLDGKPPVLVTADYLTDDAWRKVCKRAAALRAPFRPTLVLAPPSDSPSPGEGLVDEVVAILSDKGKLSATELHERLSPEVRDGMTVRDLGVALGRERGLLTQGYTERGRAWRLVEGSDSVGRGV